HPHQGDRTMRKQLRALIFAAGVALTTACGATLATGGPGASVAIPALAPAAGVQQVSVTVGSAMQFAPSSLVVRVGPPVELTLRTGGGRPHELPLTHHPSPPATL